MLQYMEVRFASVLNKLNPNLIFTIYTRYKIYTYIYLINSYNALDFCSSCICFCHEMLIRYNA